MRSQPKRSSHPALCPEGSPVRAIGLIGAPGEPQELDGAAGALKSSRIGAETRMNSRIGAETRMNSGALPPCYVAGCAETLLEIPTRRSTGFRLPQVAVCDSGREVTT